MGSGGVKNHPVDDTTVSIELGWTGYIALLACDGVAHNELFSCTVFDEDSAVPAIDHIVTILLLQCPSSKLSRWMQLGGS